MTVGGGKEYQFYGGKKKKVENESIFMQILDKVKAQTNNPAQQPAPPTNKKVSKEKGKTCSYAFNTIPWRSQV